MAKTKTASPDNDRKGCLCDDGKTYSKECCKGELKNQGIGSTQDQNAYVVTNENSERTLTNLSQN